MAAVVVMILADYPEKKVQNVVSTSFLSSFIVVCEANAMDSCGVEHLVKLLPCGSRGL